MTTGGGGGGGSPFETLMIYRNGLRPKCVPDGLFFQIYQMNYPIFRNCFTEFVFKVELKSQVLIYSGDCLDTKTIMVGENLE